jgi:hypothetical protein
VTLPTLDIMSAPLGDLDPEVAETMRGELGRQRGTLEMIS